MRWRHDIPVGANDRRVVLVLVVLTLDVAKRVVTVVRVVVCLWVTRVDSTVDSGTVKSDAKHQHLVISYVFKRHIKLVITWQH